MVKSVFRAKQQLYQCDECGMRYDGPQLAARCRAWCKKHKSCSLEIIEHALKPPEKS